MRAWPVAAVVSLVLLAGCFGGGGDGGGPSGDPSPTTSASACQPAAGERSTTRGPSAPMSPEDDNGVFYVAFCSEGPATLEVPFPHLDACMAPQDWMAGDLSVAGNATVRDAGDGRAGQVLALSGEGQVSFTSQVALKEPCATLRHDPWSVDPDPADGTVEVRAAAGEVDSPSVLVRWMREGCGNATLHEGEAGAGWSALAGRSVPVAAC